MNPLFVNKSFHFREQDSADTVLLLFFILLPTTALFPHAHILCACLLLFVLWLGIRFYGFPQATLSLAENIFLCFLSLCLSALVLTSARKETMLACLLRLSFFLPTVFKEKRARILRFYAAVCGVIGFFAFVSLCNGGGVLGYTDTSRFSALSRAAFLFGNPNVLAAYLLPASLISLYDALFEKKNRLTTSLVFSGCLLGICATFSRGALLAFLFSAFLLLIRRFGFGSVMAVAVAVSPLLLLLLPASLSERLSSLSSPDSSVFYRFSLWKSIFRLPPRTLLFGVGEGKTAMLSTLSPVLAAGLTHIEHTHSLFLHLWLAHGGMGLFLFLWLSLLALASQKKLSYAYLSLMLFGFFDDPLYNGQTEVIFWLLLGASQKEGSLSSSRFCFFAQHPRVGTKRRGTPPHTSFTPPSLR